MSIVLDLLFVLVCGIALLPVMIDWGSINWTRKQRREHRERKARWAKGQRDWRAEVRKREAFMAEWAKRFK